ncbi:nuclease-related domain-containing protein [Sporolactobacillus vineae]|uniref:nuclease-related domain-containing protein n=1 Tax=Sporolactobacillus vineae TaxID=444463 RepID=UPI0003030F65|nr:nuclease-related domain-containing protein [Sporolactobacillus vineae]
MFDRKFTIPFHVRQLEAAVHRFSGDRKKKMELEEQLKNYYAGCRGESAVDYPLSLLQEREFRILHSLRLPNGVHLFQMDCLLLTTRFFLLLEIKNISGTLHVDSKLHQFFREKKEQVQRFSDPFVQAERLIRQFRVWLGGSKFAHMPIEKLVVLVSPNAVLLPESADSNFYRSVTFVDRLAERVLEISRLHAEPLVTPKMLRAFSKKLCAAHQELEQNVFAAYHIDPNQIRHGVCCPECGTFPMQRLKARWSCGSCGGVSKDAHIQALKDYRLIFGPKITNQQCRAFLHLESRDLARRLLSAAGASPSGTGKAIVYHLNFN